MVSASQADGNDKFSDCFTQLEMQHAMLVAKLSSTLKPSQLTDLGNLLKATEALTQQKNPSGYYSIPKSQADLRRVVTEGPNSIMMNVPHPSPQILGDYAYIRLKDAIADALGHGIDLDTINATNFATVHGGDFEPPTHVRKCVESKRACQIYIASMIATHDREAITIWIVIWSDDMEPNTSLTKSNRGSVWVLSATICPCRRNAQSIANTYVLALGPKKGEHHGEIERLVSEDLVELQTGQARFFSAKTGDTRKVYAEIFATLQDSPERRSRLGISLGTANHSALFGTAFNAASVAEKLVPCEDCFKCLLKNEPHPDQCTRCSCFSIDPSDSRLHFPQPLSNWPPSESTPSGNLPPTPLSFAILIEKCHYAYSMFVTGIWTVLHFKTFLSSFAINDNTCERILAFARDAIDTGQLQNPLPDTCLPALWFRVNSDVKHYVDVIMHLIFLGVVKKTCLMITDWTVMKRKGTSFKSYANGTLERVQVLNLDWAKALPFGEGTLGGWVSDNCLAWARLSKWMYGGLTDIADDPEYVTPNKRPASWTKKENHSWLRAHGITIDYKLNAEGTRLQVESLMKQQGGPPSLAVPRGGKVEPVQNVLIALTSMVSHVMVDSSSPADVDALDRHIKIFLASFEQFDVGMREAEARKKPQWIQASNFLTLLNLPAAMALFGPLRLLWEGGVCGEGIVRYLKPLINGLKGAWARNALVRFMRIRSLGIIIQHLFPKNSNNNSNTMHDEDEIFYKGFRSVSTSAVAKKIFLDHNVLSVVELKEGGLFMVTKKMELIPVKSSKDHFIGTVCGAAYFSWELATTEAMVSDDTSFSNLNSRIKRVCLMLPRLGPDGNPIGAPASGGNRRSYYTIASDWMEVSEHFAFCRPPGVIGSDYIYSCKPDDII